MLDPCQSISADKAGTAALPGYAAALVKPECASAIAECIADQFSSSSGRRKAVGLHRVTGFSQKALGHREGSRFSRESIIRTISWIATRMKTSPSARPTPTSSTDEHPASRRIICNSAPKAVLPQDDGQGVARTLTIVSVFARRYDRTA
jgi:hypothetical protein